MDIKTARCPFCHAAHQWSGAPEPWNPALSRHDRKVRKATIAEVRRRVEALRNVGTMDDPHPGDAVSLAIVEAVDKALAILDDMEKNNE